FNAGAAGSDRNTKTDVEPVKPADILSKLLSMPIESWRYTNDIAAIRHLGPMAQDFKSAFKLGDDERIIELMDEGGVALAAIQGLNQKVDLRVKQLEEDLKCRETENAELRSELSELKQLLRKVTSYGGQTDPINANHRP